jgi:endonuclease-3
MRAAFPTWTDVLAAPRPRLERALRPAGLARTRSGRIQRILRAIQNEHGRLDLRHLGKLPDEDARVALLSYEGVGPKTAECVLLFALGRSVFPVDTHIHRILTRLEILPVGMTPEKAHRHLLPLIPRGAHLSLHLNLIEHGRKVCRPHHPACPDCVLRRWCLYNRRNDEC